MGRGGDFVTKSGHERVVPVRGQAWDILERIHAERSSEDNAAFVFLGYDGNQLDATYLSKRFLKFRRLARLTEGLTFHSLRHGYIARLIEEGVPLPVVQKLAGALGSITRRWR